MAEWVVGVRWVRAVPKDQAKEYPGVFANQNIVCKLQDQPTLAFLKTEFHVDGTPNQNGPSSGMR